MQPTQSKDVFCVRTFLHRFPLVGKRLIILGACCLLSVIVPVHSWAGGLYITEFGTPSTGVANAGAVAVAHDASTAWHNPAGMTHISGNQLMGAAGVIIPNIKFDPDSDTPVSGGDGGQAGEVAFPIGASYVHSLTDNLKFGLSLGSFTGSGLDYGSNWAGRQQVTETEILILTAQPGVAIKMDWLSVGLAFQASYGELDQDLKAPNPAETTIKLDGDDWAFGFTGGILIDFNEGTRLGVRYQSKNEFNFEGDLKTSGGALGGIKVNSEAEFIFPQYVEVGFYHEINDQFAFLATVNWEDWSQFDEIPITTSAGPSGGLPTSWNDTYKLAGGLHYRPSKPWLLMTGFAYDSNPVDAKDRTADLPVDRQLRYAVGAQYQWSARLNFGGNFEYLDLGDAKINNSSTLKGDYKRNEAFFLAVNANWTF